MTSLDTTQSELEIDAGNFPPMYMTNSGSWQTAIQESYVGKAAVQYEERRSRAAKWRQEQRWMEVLLGRIQPGSFILDIPVGTGRFISLYQKLGLHALGMDVSNDMLAQARRKGGPIDLRSGNALAIALPDASVDAAVCVRFLNWLSHEQLCRVLSELGRVTRRLVILSVRLTERAEAANQGSLRFHTTREFAAARENCQLEVEEMRLIEHRHHGDYSMILLRHRHGAA